MTTTTPKKVEQGQEQEVEVEVAMEDEEEEASAAAEPAAETDTAAETETDEQEEEEAADKKNEQHVAIVDSPTKTKTKTKHQHQHHGRHHGSKHHHHGSKHHRHRRHGRHKHHNEKDGEMGDPSSAAASATSADAASAAAASAAVVTTAEEETAIGLQAVRRNQQQHQQQQQEHLFLVEFLNDKVLLALESTEQEEEDQDREEDRKEDLGEEKDEDLGEEVGDADADADADVAASKNNNNKKKKNQQQNQLTPNIRPTRMLLYERSSQIKQLHTSFLRTVTGIQPEQQGKEKEQDGGGDGDGDGGGDGDGSSSNSGSIISLVVGDGGVGKTSLVQHAFGSHSPHSHHHFVDYYFFLRGKFDIFKDARPLAPLSQCLEQLTDQILALPAGQEDKDSDNSSRRSSLLSVSGKMLTMKQKLATALKQVFEIDDLVAMIQDGIWTNLHKLLDLDVEVDVDEGGGSGSYTNKNTNTFYLTMMISIWRTITKTLDRPMVVFLDDIDQAASFRGSSSSSHYVEFFDLLKHLLLDTAAVSAANKASPNTHNGHNRGVHFVLSFRPVSNSHPINDVLRHVEDSPREIEFSPIILSSDMSTKTIQRWMDNNQRNNAATIASATVADKIMNITKGNPSMIQLLLFQQQQIVRGTSSGDDETFTKTLNKIERKMITKKTAKGSGDDDDNDMNDTANSVNVGAVISSIIDQLLRVKSSSSLGSESSSNQELFAHHDRKILDIASSLGSGLGGGSRSGGSGSDDEIMIDLDLLQRAFSASVSTTTSTKSSSDDPPNSIQHHIKLNQHRELVNDCMDKYVRYGIIEKVTVTAAGGGGGAKPTTTEDDDDAAGESWEGKVLETKKLQRSGSGRGKNNNNTTDATGYKFVCSTYQKAIYEMIPEDQKSKIHATIGHVVLLLGEEENKNETNKNCQLMRAMSHLQLGFESFDRSDQERKIGFSLLALESGHLAKRWRLYHTSCGYYANGLKSLQSLPIRHGDSFWKLNYELALDLTLGLATCCLYTESYEDTRQFHSEICDHACRAEDIAKADMLLIEMYTKQHRYQEAVELGEHTLSTNLGVSIANKVTMDDTKRTFCNLVGLGNMEENAATISDNKFESSILQTVDSITAVAVQPDPLNVTSIKILSMLLGPVLLQTTPQSNEEIDIFPIEDRKSYNGDGDRSDILSVVHQMMKLVLCPGGCGSTSLTQLTLSSLTSLFTSKGFTVLVKYCETLRQSLLLVAEGTATGGSNASAVHVVDKSSRGRCLLFGNGLLQLPAGRKSQNQLKVSYRLCNDAGDTDFAMIGVTLSVINLWISGGPLQATATAMRATLQVLERQKYIELQAVLRPLYQMTLNLLGVVSANHLQHSKSMQSRNTSSTASSKFSPYLLVGDVIDDVSAEIHNAKSTKNQRALLSIYISQASLAFFMHKWEACHEILDSVREEGLVGGLSVPLLPALEVQYYFLHGMTTICMLWQESAQCTSGWISSKDVAQRKEVSLETARTCIKRLESHYCCGSTSTKSKSSTNHVHQKVQMIKAEMEVLGGQFGNALELFSESMSFSQKHGHLCDQALACERAGLALRRAASKEELAMDYLEDAVNLYRGYQSLAKVNHLKGNVIPGWDD